MSQLGSSRGGQPGFQVAEIVSKSFVFIFRNLSVLVFLGLAPMAVALVLTVAGELLHGNDSSALWHLGANLALLYVLSSFSVSWNRYVLLGEISKQNVLEVTFGPREARFFLYFLIPAAPGILIGLLSLVLPAEALAGPFWLLLVLHFVLLLRLALLFPAVSLDQDRGIAAAWNQLTGSSWRLFLAWLLTTVPLVLASIPLVAITAAVTGDVLLANRVISGCLELLVLPLVLTVVAFVYRALTGQQPPVPPASINT